MNINSTVFIPLHQQQKQEQQQHAATYNNWRKSPLPPTAIAATYLEQWPEQLPLNFTYFKNLTLPRQQQQHFFQNQQQQLQQQQQNRQHQQQRHKNQNQLQWSVLAKQQEQQLQQKSAIKNQQQPPQIQQQCKKQPFAVRAQNHVQKPSLHFELEATAIKKRNDATQRNASKNASNNRKSHNNYHPHQRTQKQHNSPKQDSTDSGISTTASQASKSRRYGRNRNQQRNGNVVNSINNNNNKNANNATAARSGTAATSSYSLKNWLSSDMVFCYENRFDSSIAEDNPLPRHNPAHRSSTSSDMGVNDELHVNAKTKKSTIRQRRFQKRQPQDPHSHNNSTQVTPMDIAANDEKENRAPLSQKHEQANKKHTAAAKQQQAAIKPTAANLRKKCTTAAALKQLQPSSKQHSERATEINTKDAIAKAAHALCTTPSFTSVCSSISSMASISSDGSSTSASVSVASSASSTPAHSASSSPSSSPAISKRHFVNARKSEHNLSEAELVELLRPHIIQPEMLRVYGFPVESPVYKHCIEIYKCIPKPGNSGEQQQNALQSDDYQYQQRMAMMAKLKQRRRDSVSSPYDSSDSSEVGDDEPILATASYSDDGMHEILKQYDQALEKNCMRCKRPFKVSPDGIYLTEEPCSYHSGKLVQVYTGTRQYEEQFTCCQRTPDLEGCQYHDVHVWSGTVVGINGPYTDFEHTKFRYTTCPNVYALDCEMCITGRGLEVTKITVIGFDGELVYEHFVLPQAPIVDYNTRFSGITAQDLDASRNDVKTLAEVQHDLLQLFNADTILIGHALENDLRALRIVHKTIVDTSIVFPAHHGFPYRRALKTLARTYLYREIQTSQAGHCSLEDSRACLDLMLYRLRHPF